MAKRRPKNSQEPVESNVESVVAEPVTETVEGLATPSEKVTRIDRGEKPERVVVALDASGRIALDSMRDSTIEKLRKAAEKTPELFPQAPKLPPIRIPDGLIATFYSVLGAIESTVAARKFPADIAATFAYSEADIATLMEPTQAVAAKYVPKSLNRWKEEFDLIGALVEIHFMKLRACALEMERREKAAVDLNANHPFTEAA